MTKYQKLLLEQSEKRQRLNDLLGKETLSDEEHSEMDGLTKRAQEIEVETRAALVLEGEPETREVTEDAEHRERVELRSRASLTSYLTAAMQGRMPSGAEAELNAAAGVGEAGIPLELWDTEKRVDVITGAPGTVGVNLDRIRPAVFANAVLPRLGVEMPRVESGSYASATISTPLTAGSQAKGGVAESTAAAFTVTTVTPKRISARLSIRIEDVAAVGQANFESILRENLSLVLSDELDGQGLNGVAAAPNANDINGLFQALTDPTTAPTAVADFDAFAAAFADGVDGLWANGIGDVMILAGPLTYALSAKTFQTATNYKGELSAAAYAMMNTGGWMTNKRMPDADTFLTVDNVQQAILTRKARSFLNMGEGYTRTAVCPHWNFISIDDIYSGSAQGERFATFHMLLGDVIVVQPDAYRQVAFRTA